MLMGCSLYIDGRRVFSDQPIEKLLELARDAKGFVWLEISDPTEVEFDKYAEVFGIHPLAVEDVVHGMQRPKIEDYGDQEFMVLKTLHYDDASSQVATGDVMFCIGPHFVVTIAHRSAGDLEKIHDQFSQHPERAQEGPYAVLHAILDVVVDDYSIIARELEADVANIEIAVFSNMRRTLSQEIYFLKREVAEFRQAAEPLRPLLRKLVEDDALNNPVSMRPFFRDVEDHLNRAADAMVSQDSLLTSVLNADL
ncbi:MAG: hypothetical protein RIS43_995, partial [Actinomycetota bacterium]